MIAKSSGDYTASDNREADPLFADAERFDFHLRRDSPAIDRGTRDSAIATDLAGTARPLRAGYDIGAFEYRE